MGNLSKTMLNLVEQALRTGANMYSLWEPQNALQGRHGFRHYVASGYSKPKEGNKEGYKVGTVTGVVKACPEALSLIVRQNPELAACDVIQYQLH